MRPTYPPIAQPRLFVVAPAAYPFGGVATWLDGLVAGLRERGWPLEIGLLAGAHHDVDRYLAQHPLGEVRRIANPGGSREGRQRSLAAAIAAARAEVVLAVNVGDVEDAVDRLRRSRRASPRLITTQHGLQVDFYEHLRSRREVVDGVVVTNRLAVELAREYARIERDRIAYAPYGVETPDAELGTGDGPLRIVWAGRLEQPQKRVGDLPGICARLDALGVDYRLDVAGSGPEAARLEGALASQLSAGRVRLLGEVPRERLRERVYDRSHLLLVTSSWETGPIVAWEALVAGLAIVSSNFLGIAREAALRDGETALLYEVGDSNAAAEALMRARDADLRRSLVGAGRAVVQARYSRLASLDAWESAILRLGSLARREPRLRAEPPTPSGRLDRWLGPGPAETVRRTLGIRHRQASPGDEWPHALCGSQDAAAFVRLAAALDRPPPAVAEARP